MVEPPVLIPRPETEEWVMRLLRIMTKSKEDILAPCRVLDLCSGSGCVSLALAKHAPVGFYTGLDISEKAVNIAQHNADIHDLNNIMFKQVDIFDDAALEAAKLARYDIIVANPPYIPPREYETLDASVKDWEDRDALVGHYRASGRTQLDGLDFYHRIREISDKYLAKEEKRALTHHTPRLVLEFGKGQAQAVQEIFKDKKTVIQRDFNLLERSIDIYDDLEVEKEREARERRGRADSRFDDFHDENLKMYSLY